MVAVDNGFVGIRKCEFIFAVDEEKVGDVSDFQIFYGLDKSLIYGLGKTVLVDVLGVDYADSVLCFLLENFEKSFTLLCRKFF